jgi:phage terminase large subunit
VATAKTIRKKMLPKQMQFVRADERYVMYSGCFGGGKTVAICAKLVSRARRPGSREGLCRKTLVALKATTLRTLLDGDGDIPPLLPPGTYTHNKNEKIIKIKGGGEIVYFGLDDPTKIGSYNLSGCGIDEAVELTEADWTMLIGRIRTKVDGMSNQIYGATNPGVPSHWIARKFGLAGGNVPEPGHIAIPTRTTDNHYLPEDYVEDLRRLTGIAFKRYFLGEWAGSDGLVFDGWNRDHHIEDRGGPWKRSVLCCDDGYTDPFVCLSLREDTHGRRHVDRMVYQSKLTEDEKIQRVKALMDDHEKIVVDAAAPGLIEAMCRAGLPAYPSQKGPDSVFRGIVQIQGALQDGFSVSPNCTDLIREFEAYEWRKTKDGQMTDKPIDAFNHAIDALRYGFTEMSRGSSLFIDTPKRSNATRLQRFMNDD